MITFDIDDDTANADWIKAVTKARLAGELQISAQKRDKPASLYVRRDLLNAKEFIAWAKGEGFDTTLPADEIHVTIAYSKEAVPWDEMGEHYDSLHIEGGQRAVISLGDSGAIVLRFDAEELEARWAQLRKKGCSWDYEGFKPHVTITYNKPEGLDLKQVKPYEGPLEFGAEVFATIVDGWKDTVVEKREFDPSKHPREPKGSPRHGGRFAKILGGTDLMQQPVSYFRDAAINATPTEEDNMVARNEMIDEVTKHVIATDNEAAAWLDSNGRRHYRNGNGDTVAFQEIERDILEGSIFYHSHPSGFPLSGADLALMAHMNVKEMHAVDRWGGEFVAEPMPGVDFKELGLVYNGLNNSITGTVSKAYAYYKKIVEDALPEEFRKLDVQQTDVFGRVGHGAVFYPDHVIAYAHYDTILRTMADMGLIKYRRKYGAAAERALKAIDATLREGWDPQHLHKIAEGEVKLYAQGFKPA